MPPGPEFQGLPNRAKNIDVSIPDHVNTLKNGLLDFDSFLGEKITILVFEGEASGGAIPTSASRYDGQEDVTAPRLAREKKFLENARALAKGAQRLGNRPARDVDWRRLFRTVVTTQLDDVSYFSSSLPKTINLGADGRAWDADVDALHPDGPRPRPDFYLGFEVHNMDGQSNTGFRDDPSFQNFSIDTLSQLTMEGLRCTPISRFLTEAVEKELDDTLFKLPLCFPWCVLQLKGAEKEDVVDGTDDSGSKMVHEASTAASGALVMLERLARFADVKDDGQHIPPVVTVTSVGPNITVWIAFSEIIDDQYRYHKSINIWQGCISKAWDAIQFCRIMENLLYWAHHILRPKVSNYIDQWRLRYCPDVENVHSRLEEDLETAELVHRIQDRLSSLNISPSSELPELIRQAVIFQEVTRSNLQRTEPTPRQGPGLGVQGETEGLKQESPNPKLDDLAVESSDEDLKKQEKHEDGQPKEEDNRDEQNGENDSYDPPESHEKPSIQSKPPEMHTAVFTNLPLRSKSSETVEIVPTEPKKAAPKILPPSSEQALKSEPGVDLSADEERKTGVSFWYPYEFKISDFDFHERPFPLYSFELERAYLYLRERHNRTVAWETIHYLLPLRKHCYWRPAVDDTDLFDWTGYQRVLTTCKDGDPSTVEASTMTSSNVYRKHGSLAASPNPFVATSFQLSFNVKEWSEIMLVERPSPPFIFKPRPSSALPTHGLWSTTMDWAVDSIGRPVRPDPPKRRKPEPQPAEALGSPLSKAKKIPWKGGSIVVRLPPAISTPLSESLIYLDRLGGGIKNQDASGAKATIGQEQNEPQISNN